MKKILYTILLILLSGCASQITPLKESNQPLTKKQRIEKLKQLNSWKINGKLAFIQAKKRESANIFWHIDNANQSQQLALTSYLGINVLSLSSKDGVHTLEVDGESYQSLDLEQLIYELTELTLPIKAMHYWVKGLRYSETDDIEYDPIGQNPSLLTSFYNGLLWQISYADYQMVNGYPLAKKITIKQNGLTIKIRINKWTI